MWEIDEDAISGKIKEGQKESLVGDLATAFVRH